MGIKNKMEIQTNKNIFMVLNNWLFLNHSVLLNNDIFYNNYWHTSKIISLINDNHSDKKY